MIVDALTAERAAMPRRWLLFAPVAFGLGIGGYFLLRFEPPLAPAAVASVMALIIAFTLRNRPWWPVPLMLALGVLGFTHAVVRAQTKAAPIVVDGIYNIEGRMVARDQSRSGRLRFWLTDLTIEGLEQDQTPRKIRLNVDEAAYRTKAGQRVLVKAKLSRPGGPVEPGGFDFRRWAWFRDLGGVGFALGPVMRAPDQGERTPADRVTSARLTISDKIMTRIGGTEGGFAAAIFTGDRSGVDLDSLDALRASNLAHLLAISGLHMGLVTGFVFALIRVAAARSRTDIAARIPIKKLAAACAILAGAAYLVLSGGSVATQRAFVMVCVMFIAVLLDRRAVTLRAVAIAAMIVLALRPESLTEAGFQMSFAATCALVTGFEILSKFDWWRRPAQTVPLKALKWALGLAISSMLAGAATAPFSAYHFNAIAQYGLAANLMAVPIMGSIVMPSGVVAAILAPIGLEGPFLWVAGQGISAILWVAELVAGWEGARRPVAATHLFWLMCVVGGGLLLMLSVTRFRYFGFGWFVLAAVFWQSTTRPDLLISADQKIFGIMTDAGRTLSRARGAGFVAESWLQNDGDLSTQKAAFARDASGAGALAVVQSGKTLRPDQCGSKVLVLLDETLNLPNGCAAVVYDDIAKRGAIAIYLNETRPRIVAASDLVGNRLWAGP